MKVISPSYWTTERGETEIENRDIVWKMPGEGARPVPVVMGIGVDPSGRCLILHRSPSVRSAPNTWSFPSGLHECGFGFGQQLAIEFEEELGVEVLGDAHLLRTYEVLDYERDYHWVIHLMICSVKDWEVAENVEPEKHDQLALMSFQELNEFYLDSSFHGPLSAELAKMYGRKKEFALFWQAAKKGLL